MSKPMKLYLLLFIFFSTSVFAEPKTTAELLRGQLFIDPAKTGEVIVSSWEGGSWKEKGLAGKYRFQVTEAGNGANKLYIQWLKDDGEIAYSMSVRELNQRPEYSFNLPECKSDISCKTAELTATHSYEKHEQTFLLQFPNLGKYQVKPQ